MGVRFQGLSATPFLKNFLSFFEKTLDKPPKVWYNKYIRLRETNGKPQSIKRNEVIKNGKENTLLHH
jgi:hypothetical protein